MKRPCRAGTLRGRGAGWAAETFQESDDDNDELGQQPQQCPKDLHSHAIVNATPASTQSSIVNAFTHSQPQPAQKPLHFVETPVSHNIHAISSDVGSDMDIDSFIQENNLMDPDLSTAWDDDHGLRAKRACTALVSKSMRFLGLFGDVIVG